MASFDVTNTVKGPDVRGVISLIGRAMITIGLILLLFVAYQLWGTNVFEARSQNKLDKEFQQRLQNAEIAKDKNEDDPVVDEDGDGEPDDANVVGNVNALVQEDLTTGNPIAKIKIDKIGLDHVVVSGTDSKTLKKGPGHYQSTPLPGQFGNAAIAGHRTTYGAPFHRLDELVIGDQIILETVRGTFTYEIKQPSVIVSPKDVSVIEPTPDPSDPTGNKLLATLTLTTCHPKYSAAKRLIVRAELVPTDVKRATDASHVKDSKSIDIGDNDTLGGSGIGHSNILVAIGAASLHLPLLWWFLLMVGVGLTWWYLFRRFHNWKMWIVGVLPFAFVLLLYFIQLENVLPSNI